MAWKKIRCSQKRDLKSTSIHFCVVYQNKFFVHFDKLQSLSICFSTIFFSIYYKNNHHRFTRSEYQNPDKEMIVKIQQTSNLLKAIRSNRFLAIAHPYEENKMQKKRACFSMQRIKEKKNKSK